MSEVSDKSENVHEPRRKKYSEVRTGYPGDRPHIDLITCVSRKRPVTERPLALSLAQLAVISMEQKYWIGRKRSAMARAREALSSEARLIHYELAGRYSIKAAQCSPAVLAASGASSTVKGRTLHLPAPALHCPGEEPRSYRKPDNTLASDRSLGKSR